MSEFQKIDESDGVGTLGQITKLLREGNENLESLEEQQEMLTSILTGHRNAIVSNLDSITALQSSNENFVASLENSWQYMDQITAGREIRLDLMRKRHHFVEYLEHIIALFSDKVGVLLAFQQFLPEKGDDVLETQRKTIAIQQLVSSATDIEGYLRDQVWNETYSYKMQDTSFELSLFCEDKQALEAYMLAGNPKHAQYLAGKGLTDSFASEMASSSVCSDAVSKGLPAAQGGYCEDVTAALGNTCTTEQNQACKCLPSAQNPACAHVGTTATMSGGDAATQNAEYGFEELTELELHDNVLSKFGMQKEDTRRWFNEMIRYSRAHAGRPGRR